MKLKEALHLLMSIFVMFCLLYYDLIVGNVYGRPPEEWV